MTGERIARRVEQLLDDARAALDGGERAEAQALAHAILALDPGNGAAEALLAAEDQRLRVTLLFCDLVGSTQLADVRDPEETSAILRDYRLLCTGVVARYGGFIEDRQGDGLLVRFGYPRAHEDDARRAVLSGLEIVRAVGEHPLGLQVRVAVHTGLVVFDAGEVMGATPNEAARLQSLAEPGSVVISDVTHDLVRGYFHVRAEGDVRLRGVARPMGVFVVEGVRTVERLEVATSLTPFTGRDGELAMLGEHWRRASAGDDPPPAVLVSGPAGIGKSRLVRESVLRLAARRLACGCSSYGATTSLHPFAGLLAAICEVAPRDGARERLAKLRARLERTSAGAGAADLPVLAAALGIDPGETSPPSDVDPTKLRALALHAAAELVRCAADDGPLVLLVEDLHWADGSSLELLDIVLSAPRPGLLLVMTARPDFAVPWPETLVRPIALEPLPAADLELMAGRIPEGAGLDRELQREIIARCDGIPLFLEELVRSGVAVRAGDGDASRIPDALRDPLVARLVTPGVDLALAQYAATIGADADRDLLQRACGLSDKPFASKLANLVGAGLVSVSAAGTIRFHHELLRDAAYETQRHSTRRDRHGRVADVLADGEPDPGVLAFHLERAERFAEAIAALFAAAQADQALGAHGEATARLTRVVALVERLPAGAQRLSTELTARQLRSFSATMLAGYAAPETAQDHARCVEICEHLGLAPELLPSLFLSWTYYLFRGDLDDAARVWTTIDRLSSESDLPGEMVVFTGSLKGIERFFRGDFGEACELLSSFLRDARRLDARWPLPNDPSVAIGAQLVVTLALLGHHDEAMAVGEDALARAAELDFPQGPFSAAFIKCHLAIVHMLEGDYETAARLGGETAALGDRHGFVMWALIGTMQRLASEVHLGLASSLDPLAVAVGQFRTLLSSELWAPYWLTQLAAAQIAAGRAGEARPALDEALRVATLTGSDFFSAETLRIRGELRAGAGDDRAADDLRAAVDKARAQGAGVLLRRAALALERRGDRQPATS